MQQVTKENLKKKCNKAVVALHKFLLLNARFPTDLFCFYEGKDGPYYFPRIQNFYNKDNHPIKCGNKKAVLKIHELTNNKKEYNKFKKAYFVDKDFDISIKGNYSPSIYETPCYSIENLYTSDIVLKNILKNEFNLSEIDNEYKIIFDIFKLRQNEFHTASLLFNSWYACLKELVNEGKYKSTNVSLDSKFPKAYVTITLDDVKSNYDLIKIKTDFPKAIDCDDEKLKDKMLILEKSNQQKVFRGKYELDFFNTFVNLIISDAIQKRKSDRKYVTNGTKFRLDKSQFLTQLSGYAETPGCLINYLKSFN